MIPQNIIELAIKGGWRQGDCYVNGSTNEVDGEYAHHAILDPIFWQALGCHAPYFYDAHRLYDLILNGGDTAKFWEVINQ